MDCSAEQGEIIDRLGRAEQQSEEKQRKLALAETRARLLQSQLAAYQEQDQILAQLDERRIKGHARPKSKLDRGESTAVICATDWHAEENVDPRVVNGLNEFNLDICAARLARLWDKSLQLLDFARKFTTIRDVVLWLGGDLINGYIHEENQEGNFLGPADAIEFVEGHVCDGLATLKKHAQAQRITVLCNWGNHGRSTQKRRVSTGAATSWEYLAYRHLDRLYRNEPKIEVIATRGYHILIELQGHLVRFHHGDNIRYQGGVGGISIPVNKAVAQWNRSTAVSQDVFGHWHQYLDDWRWTSCGCLVGYNAYALSIKADFQPPTQTLLVFNRQYGKILSLPIFVEAPR